MPRGTTIKGDFMPATREKIDDVITALVLSNGSTTEARRRLKEAGVAMGSATIALIRDRNAALYQQRRQELAPQLEAQVADDLLENAARSTALVGKLIAETGRRLEEGTIDEPARAARDLSQVTQQSVDKRLAIQGRPTEIREVRDVAEIIKALEGKGIVSVIDATAIEEPEKEPDDRDRANP
jgi:hypothetical protein